MENYFLNFFFNLYSKTQKALDLVEISKLRNLFQRQTFWSKIQEILRVVGDVEHFWNDQKFEIFRIFCIILIMIVGVCLIVPASVYKYTPHYFSEIYVQNTPIIWIQEQMHFCLGF